MEQIPMEVIEMAVDFFSHLSSDELSKVSNDYFLEQKFLQTSFASGLKVIKDPEMLIRFTHIYLTIRRCYKYYNIQLQEINTETIEKSFLSLNDFIKEREGQYTTTNEMCQEMQTLTQQHDLTLFIFFQLYGGLDTPIFYKNEDDVSNAYFLLFAITLILNNEMKKHVGDEIN